MKGDQKPDHISLTRLVERLRDGHYAIFLTSSVSSSGSHRTFVKLMRSIFLDYYIGSLLLWKGKPENFRALECELLYGYSGDRASDSNRS